MQRATRTYNSVASKMIQFEDFTQLLNELLARLNGVEVLHVSGDSDMLLWELSVKDRFSLEMLDGCACGANIPFRPKGGDGRVKDWDDLCLEDEVFLLYTKSFNRNTAEALQSFIYFAMFLNGDLCKNDCLAQEKCDEYYAILNEDDGLEHVDIDDAGDEEDELTDADIDFMCSINPLEFDNSFLAYPQLKRARRLRSDWDRLDFTNRLLVVLGALRKKQSDDVVYNALERSVILLHESFTGHDRMSDAEAYSKQNVLRELIDALE